MAVSSKSMLEALIAGTAAGDVDAFARLYLETKAAVCAYALSILKNPHDAEDVLHDCYLNIRISAGQYRPGGNPMAWIMTIVKHLSLQLMQRQNRSTELDLQHLQNFQNADPDDKLIVEGCLELLSDTDRQIVVLHTVAGFKHREIAEYMGLPLRTVITKYRRALQKMRNEL